MARSAALRAAVTHSRRYPAFTEPVKSRFDGLKSCARNIVTSSEGTWKAATPRRRVVGDREQSSLAVNSTADMSPISDGDVNLKINFKELSQAAKEKIMNSEPPIKTRFLPVQRPVQIVSNDENISSDAGDVLGRINETALRSVASRKPTPLSLRNMYRYASCDGHAPAGQRLRNAQFLYRELPIRIAQRAVDLMQLPYGLGDNCHVKKVTRTYVNYLEKLENMPMPTTDAEEEEFTALLRSFVMDRTVIPMNIARALADLRESQTLGSIGDERRREVESALYRFFTARVGLRFLTEHHVLSKERRQKRRDSLRKSQNYLDETEAQEGDSSSDSLGCIQKDCDPVREAQRVANQVRQDCFVSLGVAPEIDIIDGSSRNAKKRHFTYVPHHLHYMMAELFTNSCMAVVRSHAGESSELPPIKVVIVKGAEDVTIKISDQGGGIPRSLLKNIWAFSHSTLDEESLDMTSDDFTKDPFTGGHVRGFGLPLARIYSRYFGGELVLKSMEGHGVDAYLYLPVLGDACENLPDRVNRSPGNMDSNPTELCEDLYCGSWMEGSAHEA